MFQVETNGPEPRGRKIGDRRKAVVRSRDGEPCQACWREEGSQLDFSLEQVGKDGIKDQGS